MTLLTRAEDIANAIHARIAACTLLLGAETDIGRHVYHGRRAIDDTMIPCASIIEADDTPAQKSVGDVFEISQRYVVFGYLPCSADNPNTAAHAAIRDMKRALFTTVGPAGVPVFDARFGGQVRAVAYKGRDIGPRADGAAFVVAAVEIEVTYVEHMSKP